ncbi:hypothetical protein P692DRAFT_20527755 [Suillus brevipes Sb2]|nr:hypothetical protein P692DRAFT_20527755 [Suillus brevipes Sb2]
MVAMIRYRFFFGRLYGCPCATLRCIPFLSVLLARTELFSPQVHLLLVASSPCETTRMPHISNSWSQRSISRSYIFREQ